MMRHATLALITVPFAAVILPPAAIDHFGCGSSNPAATHDTPQFLTLVNAEVIDTAVVDIDTLEIQAVEVICWAKAERMFGVTVRSGVASVWTHNGPWDAMKNTLAALVDLQRAHVATHGTYAGGTLLRGARPEGVSVEVVVHATGWEATAKHAHVDYACLVYEGSGEPPHRDLTEGEPACFSQHNHGE